MCQGDLSSLLLDKMAMAAASAYSLKLVTWANVSDMLPHQETL